MGKIASWSTKHNYILYKLKTNEVIAGKQINIMKDDYIWYSLFVGIS